MMWTPKQQIALAVIWVVATLSANRDAVPMTVEGN
jgi:hypothetical protein